MSTVCMRLTPNADSVAIGTSCSADVSLVVQRAGNGRATSTARQRASNPDQSSFSILGWGLPEKLGSGHDDVSVARVSSAAGRNIRSRVPFS